MGMEMEMGGGMNGRVQRSVAIMALPPMTAAHEKL